MERTVIHAGDGILDPACPAHVGPHKQWPACAREFQTVNQLDGYRVEILEM